MTPSATTAIECVTPDGYTYTVNYTSCPPAATTTCIDVPGGVSCATGDLPMTGFNDMGLALIGILLVAIGYVLWQWTR